MEPVEAYRQKRRKEYINMIQKNVQTDVKQKKDETVHGQIGAVALTSA